MGVSRKDLANVAKLSGLILGTVFTGGAAAVVGPIVGAVGGLIDPGDEENEQAWMRKQIPIWKKLCAELMDIPMSDHSRRETLVNRVDADWFTHYGQRAKKRLLEKLHADILFAVTAEMAATVPE